MVGVYAEPPVMLALSTFAQTPNLSSVTAPCAPPSALVTMLNTSPVRDVVLKSIPVFAIVNDVDVGTLSTSPLTLNVSSSLHTTRTWFPTFSP